MHTRIILSSLLLDIHTCQVPILDMLSGIIFATHIANLKKNIMVPEASLTWIWVGSHICTGSWVLGKALIMTMRYDNIIITFFHQENHASSTSFRFLEMILKLLLWIQQMTALKNVMKIQSANLLPTFRTLKSVTWSHHHVAHGKSTARMRSVG